MEMQHTGALGENGGYASQVIRGNYYPHVDGIRAVAVLAVLLYHLGESLCPGGFAGVDVFFVISGYLIGGGIIRDLRAGAFSFQDFYTRRIKRIMPAYFAVIVATLIAGFVVYHYELLESLGNAAGRSSYFFANFFCYKFLGSYFAGDGDMHPLLNLWSLSVEEQFYIVIPLLMFLLWKLRKGVVLPVLLLLLVGSLMDAEHLLASETSRHIVKAFYMADARAWELLVGVVIAWFPRYERKSGGVAGKVLPACASTLGLLLVLASYALIDARAHFPGTGALCAVCGAGLMIVFGAYGPVSRILSQPLVVGVGRISYSLYLWHWPIIAFMHYFFSKSLSPAQMAAATALSLLVSYASWRYIEMPVRRNKNISFAKAVCGLLCICLLVGGTGAVLKQSRGLVHVIHQDANRYHSLDFPPSLPKWNDGDFGLPQLNLRDEKGKRVSNVLERVGCESAQPDFFVMGDSHAEALKIGFDHICRENGRAGVVAGLKTCPLSGISITNTFANQTEELLAWLENAPSIRKVIIICRWDTRLSGSPQKLYRNGEDVPADSSRNSAYLEEGLQETCRRIRAMGKEVVLTAPVPVLRLSPGSELRRRIMLGLDTTDIGDAVSAEEYRQFAAPIMDILQRVAARTGSTIVPVAPHLEQDGCYRGVMDDVLMYHDCSHLTAKGAEHVISRAYPDIFKKD